MMESGSTEDKKESSNLVPFYLCIHGLFYRAKAIGKERKAIGEGENSLVIVYQRGGIQTKVDGFRYYCH